MLIAGALALLGASTKAVLADHISCAELHAAAYLDEPEELSNILLHGVDLNCRDALLQTPLITATDGASLDIVKILLNNEVAINARDEIGETALTKARQKLDFFDMKGGEGYRNLYLELIALLENAGAVE